MQVFYLTNLFLIGCLLLRQLMYMEEIAIHEKKHQKIVTYSQIQSPVSPIYMLKKWVDISTKQKT